MVCNSVTAGLALTTHAPAAYSHTAEQLRYSCICYNRSQDNPHFLMDRTGKKRKAAPASSPDERDAKRQKTPVSSACSLHLTRRRATHTCANLYAKRRTQCEIDCCMAEFSPDSKMEKQQSRCTSHHCITTSRELQTRFQELSQIDITKNIKMRQIIAQCEAIVKEKPKLMIYLHTGSLLCT